MILRTKKNTKHLLYWSGLLLVCSIFLFFKLAQLFGVDYGSYYYPLRGLQVIGLAFLAIGIYLHRCESCNKVLLGSIFAKKCKACNGKS